MTSNKPYVLSFLHWRTMVRHFLIIKRKIGNLRQSPSRDSSEKIGKLSLTRRMPRVLWYTPRPHLPTTRGPGRTPVLPFSVPFVGVLSHSTLLRPRRVSSWGWVDPTPMSPWRSSSVSSTQVPPHLP